MSNAVLFLESLGRNQAFMSSSAAYAAAIANLDVDGLQRQALLDQDHAALTRSLGGRDTMRCLVLIPEYH